MQLRLHTTGNSKPAQRIRRQQRDPKLRTYSSSKGIDFVRCCICGKHLQLISGKHLSIHDIDPETYMQEYRLSPDKLCSKSFRLNHSSRRDYRPHGKPDWIAAIKNLYKKNGHVFAGYLQDNYSHLYLQGIWLFDNWDAALRSVGFRPEKMRMWRYWDQERITKQIQLMRENSAPLYAAYILKHHAKLFSVARRQYGSWTKALTAAGIETPVITRGGRHGVLRALCDRLEQRSMNDMPQWVRLHAAYYFGSLDNATAILRSNRRLSTGWSKAKLMSVITRMHRSKRSLAYAEVRHDNVALVSAAEAYFGTWGNALHASGVDPNLYFRRKWRKRSMTAKRDRLSYGNVFKPTVSAL
jgi:hypothetical protein